MNKIPHMTPELWRGSMIDISNRIVIWEMNIYPLQCAVWLNTDKKQAAAGWFVRWRDYNIGPYPSDIEAKRNARSLVIKDLAFLLDWLKRQAD